MYKPHTHLQIKKNKGHQSQHGAATAKPAPPSPGFRTGLGNHPPPPPAAAGAANGMNMPPGCHLIHPPAFPFPAVGGGQHVETEKETGGGDQIFRSRPVHGLFHKHRDVLPCRYYKLLPSCALKPPHCVAFSASVPVLCSVDAIPVLRRPVQRLRRYASTTRLVSSIVASTMQCRSLCSRIVHALVGGLVRLLAETVHAS